MIATYPVGGVGWDYGQYALGLERLGYEVFYLEDTGGPTYDPQLKCYGEDPSYGIAFLKEAMQVLSPGLVDRWHFRASDGSQYGISDQHLQRILSEAELFLNVSGSALLRDEYMGCRRKVLIDTDPGWNHFVNYPRWDHSPGWQGTHGYRAHDHFFTYAERIGRRGCTLPDLGIMWRPTRPPVVLDCWKAAAPGTTWTTVMTWNNFAKAVEHEGVTYGTKEREFSKVETLPTQVNAKLEVAVGGSNPPTESLHRHGWSVVDSHDVSKTLTSYRNYIQQSRGEFSVAKNLYVQTGSGWSSCRTVCYLAAGLPTVVQDTGFSEIIECGEGLLAFNNLGDATRGINEVESHYAYHCRKARFVAEKYFASDVVLGKMLDQMGLE